jgi:ubiquitin-like domain-containing CTD phosphatase 1
VQAKLERRIKMTEVTILNEPRPGKKLLVVDIDYTIFDLGVCPPMLCMSILHRAS